MSKRRKKKLSELIPSDISNINYRGRVADAKDAIKLYGTVVEQKDTICYLINAADETVVAIGWGTTRNRSIIYLYKHLRKILIGQCNVD